MSYVKENSDAVATLVGALFTLESVTAPGVNEVKQDLVSAIRAQVKPLLPPTRQED